LFLLAERRSDLARQVAGLKQTAAQRSTGTCRAVVGRCYIVEGHEILPCCRFEYSNTRFIPYQCGYNLRTYRNNSRTKCDVKHGKREFLPGMQFEDDVARQITRGVTRYFRNMNNAVLT